MTKEASDEEMRRSKLFKAYQRKLAYDMRYSVHNAGLVLEYNDAETAEDRKEILLAFFEFNAEAINTLMQKLSRYAKNVVTEPDDIYQEIKISVCDNFRRCAREGVYDPYFFLNVKHDTEVRLCRHYRDGGIGLAKSTILKWKRENDPKQSFLSGNNVVFLSDDLPNSAINPQWWSMPQSDPLADARYRADIEKGEGNLSEREIELITRISEGWQVKEIAEEWGVPLTTACWWRDQAYKKARKALKAKVPAV